MNLALPALVILLGLLPGICFFYAYFAGRFERRNAGVSGTEEAALYVVFAIPIDLAAWLVYERLGFPFAFGIATHLLAGDVSDTAVHSEIATYFRQSLASNAVTYGLLLGSSFIAGSFARRLIWASRWDVYVPYLRLRHEWFYVLQGRLPGARNVISYVDVLTRLPDIDSETRLFRGVVLDFEISPSGGIESLTLGEPVRGKGRGRRFSWVHIPSDRLILAGRDIHSINITHLTVEPETAPPFGQRWRQWWRSFLREHP